MGSKSSSRSSTSQQDNTLALGDNEQGYVFHGTGDVSLVDAGSVDLAKSVAGASIEGVFNSQTEIIGLAGEALASALQLTSQTAKSSQTNTATALSALEGQTQAGQNNNFQQTLLMGTAIVGALGAIVLLNK